MEKGYDIPDDHWLFIQIGEDIITGDDQERDPAGLKTTWMED